MERHVCGLTSSSVELYNGREAFLLVFRNRRNRVPTDFTAQITAASSVIDRWLAYKMTMGRLPGLSVGLVYKDKLLFQNAYGYADVEQQRPTGPTTGYRIASFSKIFTAIAILQLAEQGKLHLDDRAQQYLPWLASLHDERTARITLRQLLTHTSGLDRDGATPHWIDFQFPSLSQIQRHVAEGAQSYTPAEIWKYSNLGYTLLGAIVRAASGIPYEDYVHQNIIQSLGLTSTSPTLTPEIEQHLAVGYGRDIPGRERKRLPAIETHVMASATGFSSNVPDLCRFIIAQFMGETTLLKDETKREMRRIQWLREGFESDWCLGLQTWKIHERRLYGHGGSFQGYQSRFGFDPERELGIVVLTNAIDAPATDLAKGAMQTIDHVITHFEEFARAENQVEQAERYEGRFTNVWGDTDVAVLNGSLVLYGPEVASPAQDFHQLRPDADGHFTLTSGNSIGNLGERVRFELDSEGYVQRLWVGPNPCEKVAWL
jgi:CubicO group peptidase (beta-lactamase class C family)